MNHPTLNEVREKFTKGDIWELCPIVAQILKEQIKSLPNSKNLSELDYRYPKDRAGVRGFLDKFFARHYFQVQNAMVV